MQLKDVGSNLGETNLRNLDLKELLNVLENTRKEEGLTQAEMSKKLGVSRQTYLNWIHGKNEPTKNKARIKEYIAKARLRKIEKKFEKSDRPLEQRLLTLRLPKETWGKLEDKDQEELMDNIEDFLKELAEREEIEA